VAFDLSDVFFITTANDWEPIPGPLRDRMEIIQLSVTPKRKVAIAGAYLVQRQTKKKMVYVRRKSSSRMKR